MRTIKQAVPRQTIWQRAGTYVILLFVLLAGGAGAWYLMGMPANPFQPQAAATQPPYYTTTVRRGSIQISASGSGTLVTDQTADLSFPTGGTVSALHVKLGDAVTKGQALAQVGNLQTLQANVAANQLAVVQAQQALDALQQNASTSLAQAFQTLVSAQDSYDKALTTDQRTAYARCSKEVTTKYAAQIDKYSQQLSSLTSASYGSDQWISIKGSYDTAVANYNYCVAYTPDEKTSASSALDVAKVALQQAQTNYNTLKAANGVDPNAVALNQAKLAQARTQLAQAQLELDGSTLYAPMDGVVTYLAAGQGSMVDTAKYITISDLSHPTLQISLDETDLNKMVVGAKVQVVFDAMPEQTLTGQVTNVTPQLVSSGNVQVAQGLARLDENSAKQVENLPLGLNASVTVIDQSANNVLLVPVQALRDLGDKNYAVFVQGSDGQLQLQPVKVGLMDTTHAEILSGLKEGDVVSTGASQVR